MIYKCKECGTEAFPFSTSTKKVRMGVRLEEETGDVWKFLDSEEDIPGLHLACRSCRTVGPREYFDEE
jgi:hypothetical protein